LMGGAYLRSRIKQAGKWDQETIVSFFLCQYCSGEYLREAGSKYAVVFDRLCALKKESLYATDKTKALQLIKAADKIRLV
ncbi:hypothetical protein, partial [Aeromonas caviae]|uniref:hypothetical protein n=1 Tax=Aeromonas caviae TaxID=648 RepID=UPI001CC728CB